MQFDDRRSAGQMLGQALIHHAGTNPIVLGLPRGGVPVADEVARMLGAHLDVWICRKLGVPFNPELGMGAVAEGPSLVLDRALIKVLAISPRDVTDTVRQKRAEVEDRVQRLRGGRPPPDVRGRTVIVVDDGIATGGTVRAAIGGVRGAGAARIVLAVPVAAPDVLASLRGDVDELVCLYRPDRLMAIGMWYVDFQQVPDREVVRILEAAWRREAMLADSEASHHAAP